MASLAASRIRIRLKAYDHDAIDRAAREIVETAQRTGATVSGPRAPADREERLLRDPLAVQGQGLARALRDPHPQAPDRHPRADPEDDRLAPAHRHAARRRRRRDQDLRRWHGGDHRQEGRHDPGLHRGRHARARDRDRGRPLHGHRAPRPRPRRLRGDPARASARSPSASSPRPSSATCARPARPPSRTLVEFRDEAGEREVGDEVTVEDFEPGQQVKVSGHRHRQGLPGHDPPPQLQPRARSRTARTTSARPARSAPAPTPPASSRA